MDLFRGVEVEVEVVVEVVVVVEELVVLQRLLLVAGVVGDVAIVAIHLGSQLHSSLFSIRYPIPLELSNYTLINNGGGNSSSKKSFSRGRILPNYFKVHSPHTYHFLSCSSGD